MAFPEIADLASRLLNCWPVRAYAPQRVWFPEDGLSLTVHIGEAETILAGMTGQFDAWFLDGFAPARNPAMWSPAVLAQIARLSAPDARLASFTVAGSVRRGLEQVGFQVEKKPGFGAKRQRLEATFPRSSACVPSAPRQPKRVAVIGAGIAGAACAQALVRRDIETIVLEAAPALGAGASGNPAGLVMPRLDRGGVLAEFFLAAYLHAVAAYEALGVFVRCGVEERAEARNAAALEDVLADPPLPEDWFRRAGASALHVRAGLVRPRAAIEAMLADAQTQYEARVQTLERFGECWVMRADDGRAMVKVDAVVLACGAALTSFEPARFLPIALSRGQIEWGEGPAPQHAITRGTYVAPFDGGVLFGATFDRLEAGAASASEADDIANARARNLAALAQLAPELAASIDPTKLNSRAALRASMPDFAPVAGLLPDAQAWLAQAGRFAHGRRGELGAMPMHSGVYVLGGLGARGLTLAPLLGEIVAGEICGEPPLLSRSALDALQPARFLVRALKRGSA